MNHNNNNYARTQGADSTMRFNKRPRYAGSTSGSSNSPRYKYQNQSNYQYSPNRSSALDSFQHNQYENNSQRYFYGNSSKPSGYSQQQSNKQSTNYPQESVASSPSTFTSTPSTFTSTPSTFTTSPSTFAASTQNSKLSSQPDKLPAKTASATVTTLPSNHLQQPFTSNIMESNNYFAYPYNFYPTAYNGDLVPTASSSGFGTADTISPYVWQTIISTPPPKLPQQQPPLPLQQPPALPPLPSPESPHLPPPPPIPLSLTDCGISEHLDQNVTNCQDPGSKTIVKIKTKRKAMSLRYKLSKMWTKDDAILALKAEEENTKKLRKDIILIIRFPDPEISREIVKSYCPDIESVHFQLNFSPRYCLIHLKPGTDVEKTIDHLSKIQFGTGYLSVESKQVPNKPHSTKLDDVDPFTLYVGNLPTTIACKTLKQHFPGALRIDIGFAQRMKYTRYAFVRYQNVHLAIEAYNRMLDAEIGGRTITIRFRRLASAYDSSNKDAEAEHNDEMPDYLSCQATSDDMTHTEVDDAGTVANSADETQDADNFEKRAHDNGNTENDNGNNKNAGNSPQQESISLEDNSTRINEHMASPLNTNRKEERASQKDSSNSLINIKTDPDMDPNDVVIRHNAISSLRENNENSIKQEQENLAIYEEFFERPQTQSNVSEISNRSDRNSLTSNTDDTDSMSQLSSNSLGEFLQSCQRSERQINSNTKDGEPPTKKNKVAIKKEPLETDNVANKKSSASSSKDAVGSMGCVKQEAESSIENLNTSVENCHAINNRKVPSSKRGSSNGNTSADFHYSTAANNDDLVPPTALFFTKDYHNKWTSSRNSCDNEDFYDEFYETQVSTQRSTSQTKFKTEPLDTRINERNVKTQQIKSQSQSNICVEKTNRYLTTISNDAKAVGDDDDVVPAHNLLGSYRPYKNVVKQESEYDDLFSVPFSRNNKPSCDFTEGSQTNSTPQINQCANETEDVKLQAADNIDEEVVVISANIPPAPKEKWSVYSVHNGLNIPRLTDLVSFNYKSITRTIPSRESSTLLIRDHLDELYDQLDADSDNEL